MPTVRASTFQQSVTVKVASTADIEPGQLVHSSVIPYGTKVVAVKDATQVQLSAGATETATDVEVIFGSRSVPRDPLDHDGDGRKGGSKKRKKKA